MNIYIYMDFVGVCAWCYYFDLFEFTLLKTTVILPVFLSRFNIGNLPYTGDILSRSDQLPTVATVLILRMCISFWVTSLTYSLNVHCLTNYYFRVFRIHAYNKALL